MPVWACPPPGTLHRDGPIRLLAQVQPRRGGRRGRRADDAQVHGDRDPYLPTTSLLPPYYLPISLFHLLPHTDDVGRYMEIEIPKEMTGKTFF